MGFEKKDAESLLRRYEECKKLGLKLDMSRGKPCKEQVDISEGLLTAVSTRADCFGEGGDYGNYGLLDGIPEMKRIWADLFGVTEKEVFVGGNSSLKLMYDLLSTAVCVGLSHSSKAWSQCPDRAFICVVPGYDRHFAVTEFLGFKLVNVNLTENGPDMDAVEKLVADENIKGIWCVPKYSNPDGVTYSDETVRRMAALKPAAKDFCVMWDNAYGLHDFDENGDTLLNIMDEAKKNGTEDMIYSFMSTSKVSFPGAGVAAIASSESNMAFLKKQMFFQTIGYDKLNQLRHCKYFGSADGIREYMKKHAAIIAPRFEVVLNALEAELSGLATWHKPKGGYFVAVSLPDGCAKRTVELLDGIGVKITGAGATFPYKRDPHDSHIRLAPTYPSIDELKQAMELFCLCVKIAYCEKNI